MSATSRHTPSPEHGAAHLLHSLLNGLSVTGEVLLSLRHDVGQRYAMQQLLSESNQCEETDPARSEALRAEAAHLID